MSEATEVPMVCVDCGGTLTAADAIWSWSPSFFSHINYSQCFSSLNERLTLATQRAEAAEAECEALRTVYETAKAWRSAWLIVTRIGSKEAVVMLESRCIALDEAVAALAVQP